MDQIRRLVERLSLHQKISLGAAVLAVVAGLFFFVRWHKESNFRPLFSNLAQEDAAQITAKLRERDVEFRVSDGGNTVMVPSESVAQIRLDLAGEGIPKSGRLGFELFDKTNLATTDFQEQVNYQRAIEGELERTVISLAEVERARVHVTFAKESVFTESRQPAKASVMLKLKPGTELQAQSILAITHLAASAVKGLQPESVSVLDTNGRLLNRPKRNPRPGDPEPDDAQIEFRQKVERDLLAKVNATLEPVLGPDHFRANVFAEVDFSSGEQSEETFDPTRSVMASQQRTEDNSGSTQSAGVPGTPSALPRPAARPGESGKTVSRRTENITYQSTRSVKRMLIPTGLLKRISLSVLIDQNLRWEGSGASAKRILEPPPPEKMKQISDLVAAAAGLQTQRGDQITVESIAFEATLAAPPPAGSDPAQPGPAEPGMVWPAWMPAPLRQLWIWIAVGVGLLAIAAGGAYVLIRRKKRKAAVAAAAGTAALESAGAATPEIQSGKSMEEQLAELTNKKLELESETINALRLSESGQSKAEVLAKHISETAKDDPAGVAQVLRTWLQEDIVAR